MQTPVPISTPGPSPAPATSSPDCSYTGCIEPWKVRLARARIRDLGFPQDQWPDLLQELVVEMAKFRHDPAKSNGAKESTALYALVTNTLISNHRTRDRERSRMVRHRARIGLDVSNAAVHPVFVEEDRTPMELDVRMAIEALPSFEQDVCRRLMHGDRLGKISTDTGVSWHTVKRVVDSLHKKFTATGLRGWVAQ